MRRTLALLLVTAWCVCGLAQTAAHSSGYAISGVVVSATTGQPLDRAEVTLNTANQSSLVAEMTTGEDGRFVFAHLTASKYSLSAARRGYIEAAYDEHEGFATAIVTGEDQDTAGLIFRLAPQAVIGGVVTDDGGDPATQARVSLYRQDMRSGLGKIVHAGSTMTDDTGAYEFARLQPGNYFIAVMATPWYATHPPEKRDAQGNLITNTSHPPLDVAYATTFYADATDSDSATPIPVKAGDHEQVNFTLHAVPAVHLSLQVPAQNGRAPAMPALRQDVFGEPDIVSTTMSFRRRSSSDGQMTVELDGLPPGHYEVELARRGGDDHVTSVDATSDAKVDVSQNAALAEVTGKVAMADGGRLPEGLAVTLHPQERRNVLLARPMNDGSFAFHGVPPGNYELAANAVGTALAVGQVNATGAVTEGHTLKMGTQAVTLSVALVEGMATVTGFAKREGKGVPGVMVLLVPKNPKGEEDLFRRDQSDSDGSFTLNHVPPGEYMVVAIEDGWTLDWARPEVIAHYLGKAQKVTVAAHKREMALPEAVEVQPK